MIRTFLSFVEEDLALVNLFRGQAKNKNQDLEFADYSVREPYNSSNAYYIKQQIAPRISGSSLTMCLYGPTTYTSSWVDWELEKALELGKPIMGVWLYDDGRIKYHPSPLAAHPRVGWNIDEIVRTMRRLVP
jgi:hypothetical protein